MGTVTKLLLLVSLFISATAFAVFMPPNNLGRQDKINARSTSMTEAEFNRLIDGVVAKLEPIVNKHGANLTAERAWNDSTVNAYAEQQGSNWSVHMFGGLARRPEITSDGFQMVMCHEMGHHLGGFPFYSSDKWAAVEGEADYFATQACAKLLWGTDKDGNARYRTLVNASAKSKCDKVYSTDATRDLCYRTAAAGYSLADLLHVACTEAKSEDPSVVCDDHTPDFDKADQSRVTSTNENHPLAQCRLDTYFAGALCNVNFNFNVIPGKDYWRGENSKGAEKIAARYSCTSKGGNSMGYRPHCWFKNRF